MNMYSFCQKTFGYSNLANVTHLDTTLREIYLLIATLWAQVFSCLWHLGVLGLMIQTFDHFHRQEENINSEQRPTLGHGSMEIVTQKLFLICYFSSIHAKIQLTPFLSVNWSLQFFTAISTLKWCLLVGESRSWLYLLFLSQGSYAFLEHLFYIAIKSQIQINKITLRFMCLLTGEHSLVVKK